MYTDATILFTEIFNERKNIQDIVFPRNFNGDYVICYAKAWLSYDLSSESADDIINTLNLINEKLGTRNNIILFLDITAEEAVDLDRVPKNFRIRFIPFWLIFTYCAHQYLGQKSKDICEKSDKFLYIPGKLNSFQRLCVLLSMHYENWFDPDKAKWSFYIPSDTSSNYYKDIEKVMSLPQKDEFFNIDLIKGYMQNLDVDLAKHTTQDSFQLTGIPYDVQIYYDVGFSIFAEPTPYCLHPSKNYLTEKTYRTIYNTMPFIPMGRHINTTLKNLGFQTFEEFYGNRNFVANPHILENTSYSIIQMKESMINNFSEIQERAVFNKQHMIDIAKDFLKSVENIIIDDLPLQTFLLRHWAVDNCSDYSDLSYAKPYG